jgi:hypothetical protein
VPATFSILSFSVLGIVLIGEIGGQAEEKASEYLRNNNRVCNELTLILFRNNKLQLENLKGPLYGLNLGFKTCLG